MKKILSIVLVVSMILVFTACSNKEYTYVISEERCNMLFSNSPEDWEAVARDSYWIQGEFVSANVDREGNLVLVLNDENIEHWRNELTNGFEEQLKAEQSDGKGYGFEYDDTYTTLIYYADKEVYGGAIIGMAFLVPEFGIMQMLDGTDPEEWYVDITMKDAETGVTVKTGRMPDDGSFKVVDEDWDKALGGATE